MENFKDYEEEFKIKLVKRYNWSVTDANNFSSNELKKAFDEKMNIIDAYFKIFNKKQDLISEGIT